MGRWNNNRVFTKQKEKRLPRKLKKQLKKQHPMQKHIDLLFGKTNIATAFDELLSY